MWFYIKHYLIFDIKLLLHVDIQKIFLEKIKKTSADHLFFKDVFKN